MSCSKLSKNAVLSGPFDSLCLPCEEHLKTAAAADSHVASAQHQARLDATHYVLKYQSDRVRKVKQGYYCEFCNKLFGTAIKVDMHVSEPEHYNKKGLQQLTRQGDNMVAFGNILLGEDSWHGFVGDSCVLCNTECADKHAHKSEPTHILKLIQTSVEFDSHGVIYRKEGNNLFHCLTCNTLFPIHFLATHFENPGHVECYEKYGDSYTKVPVSSDQDSKLSKVTENQEYESSTLRQKENNHADLNNENACSSKAKELKAGKISSPIEAKEDILNFARVNKLRVKWGKRKAYCTICNITISSSLQRMKEHVAEGSHRNKADTVPEVLTDVIPFNEFIESVSHVESLFGAEVVINEMFCLNVASFLLIIQNANRIRCQVCETSFELSQLDEHKDSHTHRNAMAAVPVLHTLASEFVREVCPGLYHCGYCHLVEKSWGKMQDHLKSTNHEDKKTFAQRRLSKYLPSLILAKYRYMERIESELGKNRSILHPF